MKTETPAAGEAAGAVVEVQGEQMNTAPPASFQPPANMLDCALLYAKRGWHVLPVHWMHNGRCSCAKKDCHSPAKHPLTTHGEKDATIDTAQIERWWRRWPDAGIGIATGPSCLVVFDIDGPDGLALFREVSGGDHPVTLMAKTGREGGFHVFYTGTDIPSSQVKGEHLDVRGTTGYAVVAPSGHPNGVAYTWVNPDQPIAPVPAWAAPWVASRSGGKGQAAPAMPGAEPPPHSQGPDDFTSKLATGLNVPYSPYEAARLRSALRSIPADIDGKTWFSIGAALHDLRWQIDGHDVGFDIWDEWSKTSTGKGPGNGEYRGRADLVKRWARFARDYRGSRTTIGMIYFMAKERGWTDETRSNLPIEFHTDLGNALRFVKRHGKNIRFIHEWRKWIIWNDNRWEIDNDGAAVRLAKETVTAMFSEALQSTDERQRAELIRHALKSQAEARLDAMVSLAESEAEVVLPANRLDADPWLLGVPNGVIELKTGKFRAGRREDFITKWAGASYDQNARCPEWLKFLDTVTGGDKELQAYLQCAIGYTLTGSVREEVAFVLHGIGNNGKSTFRETLHALFGGYALAADAGLLTERKTPGGATEEIARLKGCRFVAVNETSENDQLHEARVKFITSQDTITARNLYGHFFDFFPSHKAFVTTNHKPIVRGTDEGIWRRLHLIPFTVTIPKTAVEKDYRERRLMPELRGVLNWAIEGTAAYLREGLNPPQIVRAATDDYRQDMDVVGQWIEERCELNSAASVATGAAYDDYARWAESEIGWTLKRLKWRRHLSDRGFGATRGSHGQRIIQGLRLKFIGATPMTVIPGGR